MMKKVCESKGDNSASDTRSTKWHFKVKNLTISQARWPIWARKIVQKVSFTSMASRASLTRTRIRIFIVGRSTSSSRIRQLSVEFSSKYRAIRAGGNSIHRSRIPARILLRRASVKKKSWSTQHRHRFIPNMLLSRSVPLRIRSNRSKSLYRRMIRL